MAEDKVGLQVEIDAKGMVTGRQVAVRELDAIKAAAGQTGATLGKFDSGLGKMGGSLGGLVSSFRGLWSVVASSGVLIATTALVRDAAKAAFEAEVAEKRLALAIRNRGIEAGVTQRQLEAQAGALQKSTRFDDEAIKEAQSILLRFDSINGSNVERATRLVLDFAEALGTTAPAAAFQLGRALQDPGEAMRALLAVGGKLTHDQQAQIETFRRNGQVSEAAGVIMTQLETKISNLATTMGDTAVGASERFQHALSELKEQVGRDMPSVWKTLLAGPTEIINKLAELRGVVSAAPLSQEDLATQTARLVNARRSSGQTGGLLSFAPPKSPFLTDEELKKQQESSKLAAAALKELRAQTDALLDSQDPLREATSAYTQEQLLLSEALAKGVISADAWGEATRRSFADLNKRLNEIQTEKLRELLEMLGKLPGQLKQIDTTQGAVDLVLGQKLNLDDLGHVDTLSFGIVTTWSDGLNIASAIGDAISQWDSNLGKSLGVALRLVSVFADLGRAQDEWNAKVKSGTLSTGDRMSSASTWGSVGATTGGFFAGGDTTSFGGRSSGTYSGELGEAGGTIGGYFGPVWGAFGAIVGTVIGGFIKKGADEGVAILNASANAAGAQIRVNERGLGEKAAGIINGAMAFVQQLEASTGARVSDYAAMSVKIRGDFVDVVVAGVKKRFDNLDEAMSWAIQQEIASSNIARLDPLVAAAIAAPSSAESTDQLQKNVDAAMKILAAELGEIGLMLRQSGAEFDDLRATVVSLYPNIGLLNRSLSSVKVDELTKALGSLNAAEIAKWTNAYYSITGKEMPLAEQKKLKQAEIDIYNAEKALRIADLKVQQAALATELGIAKASSEIDRADIGGKIAYLRTKGKLAQDELDLDRQIAGQSWELLKIQYDAIGKLIEGLEQLPDIKLSDVKFGSSVGSFSNSVNNFRDAWKSGIDLFKEAILGARTGSATTALAPRDALQEQFGQFMANLGSAKTGNITALQALPQLYTSLLEMAKTYSGGGTGLGFLGKGDTFVEFFRSLDALASGFVTGPTPGKLREGNVVFDSRFYQAQKDQVDIARRHQATDQAQQAAQITAQKETTAELKKAVAELRQLNTTETQIRKAG